MVCLGNEPRSFCHFGSKLFILSGVISNCPSFFPSSILDPFWSRGLIFQCHLFVFLYCSWVSHGKTLEWFAVPFSSGPHFVRSLFYDPSILDYPAWHGNSAHSFLDLCKPLHHDKAVIHEGYFNYWLLLKY